MKLINHPMRLNIYPESILSREYPLLFTSGVSTTGPGLNAKFIFPMMNVPHSMWDPQDGANAKRADINHNELFPFSRSVD
jgi:hypothetical protein